MSMRRRLYYAFAGMLLLLLAVGGLGLHELRRYSHTLETMFRTNQDSVVSAIATINRTTEITRECYLGGKTGSGVARPNEAELLDELGKRIQTHVTMATLEAEGEATFTLREAWGVYRVAVEAMCQLEPDDPARNALFAGSVSPAFDEMRGALKNIITANLRYMSASSAAAQGHTADVQRLLVVLLVAGTLLAGVLMIATGNMIIRPTGQLLGAMERVARRDFSALDVPAAGRSEEFDRLFRALNATALKLREYEESDKAALMRSQAATQLAVDSLPAAICLLDCDGRIEVANDSAVRVFNLKPGSTIQECGWPDLADIVHRSCESRTLIAASGYEEAIHIIDGGGDRDFMPTAVPIIAESGEVTGATIILNDVTTLRRMDEMKTNMISTVSHELKTPLTSIRMAIYMLLGGKPGPLTPVQSEVIATAREDCERLLATINEVLDLTRIEGGRLRLVRESTGLRALIEWALQPLQHRIANSGLLFEVSVPDDIPPVSMDRGRMAMVFSNLFVNSTKYCGHGCTVRVTAELREHDDPPAVIITVEDNGPGIPPDQCEAIFERFVRIGEPDRRGAGLGLYISREIVRAHGGEIVCASSPGGGASFRINLPLGPEPGVP